MIDWDCRLVLQNRLNLPDGQTHTVRVANIAQPMPATPIDLETGTRRDCQSNRITALL
jgi:hypothetical protein